MASRVRRGRVIDPIMLTPGEEWLTAAARRRLDDLKVATA